MEKDLLLSCLKVILEQQSNSIFDLPICNYDHVKQFAFDNIKNAEEINGLNILSLNHIGEVIQKLSY